MNLFKVNLPVLINLYLLKQGLYQRELGSTVTFTNDDC